MSYNRKELLWWVDHPGFERKQWWNSPGVSGDLNDVDSEGDDVGNELPVIDAPAVFWETLRRHPATRILVDKVIGIDRVKSELQERTAFLYSESEWTEIARLTDVILSGLGEERRALYYLLPYHQCCWPNLDQTYRYRFTDTVPSLLKFLRPDEANSFAKGCITPLYKTGGSAHVSRTEPLVIGNYITPVEFDSESDSYLKPNKTTDIYLASETILLMRKLEEALAMVDQDLLILGVKKNASAHALAKELQLKMAGTNEEKTLRFRPDILNHISAVANSNNRVGDSQKQINRWFSKYDLRKITDAIG